MCNRNAYQAKWGKHHSRHWHGHPAKRFMAKRFAEAMGQPPVNVEERDDHYTVLVYAAGYAKADFQINIKEDNLIISAKKQQSEAGTQTDWKRREFHANGFERWFELNDKIDKNSIAAKYEDGVLKVTLPKLEGMETFRQDITVE